MYKLLKKLLKDDSRGLAMVEYVLIASLIALCICGGIRLVGNSYVRIYNNVSNSLP